jgi:ADP-ribose pyrophosphatase
MQALDETTLHSETLVEGVLLKARRDTVRTPNGGTALREWIDHPGASAVVPLFDDGTTILVRQFRYPPRRVFLEVPAGKLDFPGEAPVVVAARELEEETGWRAERFTPLGSFYPCIGYSNEVIHVFLAEGLVPGQLHLSDGEFVETVHLPFAEALALAQRGELLDMKTALALFYAEAFRMGRQA